jgi:hypothetical protein
MIYLLTCKACYYLSSLANQLVYLRPDLDLASEIMPDCWRRTLFFTWHIFLEVGKAQDLPSKIWQTLGDALIRVSFDVSCS